jgi:ABC-type Na+ efflux pump permease subunit
MVVMVQLYLLLEAALLMLVVVVLVAVMLVAVLLLVALVAVVQETKIAQELLDLRTSAEVVVVVVKHQTEQVVLVDQELLSLDTQTQEQLHLA